MKQVTLPIKQNTIALPEEWVQAMNTSEVTAVSLGDVLVIRPLESVSYEPQIEDQVLTAVEAFDQAEQEGRLKSLGNKKFKDLRNEAESIN